MEIYHKMHPESESRKMAFTIELVNYVSEAFAEVDMKFVGPRMVQTCERISSTGRHIFLIEEV